jgi:thiamine-phosphate pyrophosphorylase
VISHLPPAPFLYPIIDTGFSQNPVKDAGEFARAGARILQLRAKTENKRRTYDLIVEMSLFCLEKQVTLIVNDHVDIALLTSVGGVHLGQEDFPPHEARDLLGEKIIGFSTHTPNQFDVANQLPIDCIAIGPVYETLTKRTVNPHLGISQIIPLLERKSKPVVAIGGIRLESVPELVSSGVDGIAVISELYVHGPVYDTTSRFIDALDTTRRR